MKYQVDDKHKIVDISEVEIKLLTTQNLTKALEKIIIKYSRYSVVFPFFHKKEKEYSINMEVLPKLGFKLVSKRPVFKKPIKKRDENYTLSFKTLKDVKTKKPFKDIYHKAFKKTFLVTEYFDSLNTTRAFNRHVINKAKPQWNILAYKDRELIGFVCIKKRKYRGVFGTINSMAIDPKHQGKGYAKEILKKVENEFYKAGIKEWRESTDEKNFPMIYNFLKIGFKKKNELLSYVYNPKAAFKKFLGKKRLK